MTAYQLWVELDAAVRAGRVAADAPVQVAVPKPDPADGVVLVDLTDAEVRPDGVRLHVRRPTRG